MLYTSLLRIRNRAVLSLGIISIQFQTSFYIYLIINFCENSIFFNKYNLFCKQKFLPTSSHYWPTLYELIKKEVIYWPTTVPLYFSHGYVCFIYEGPKPRVLNRYIRVWKYSWGQVTYKTFWNDLWKASRARVPKKIFPLEEGVRKTVLACEKKLFFALEFQKVIFWNRHHFFKKTFWIIFFNFNYF